jgi:hypothetical protein
MLNGRTKTEDEKSVEVSRVYAAAMKWVKQDLGRMKKLVSLNLRIEGAPCSLPLDEEKSIEKIHCLPRSLEFLSFYCPWMLSLSLKQKEKGEEGHYVHYTDIYGPNAPSIPTVTRIREKRTSIPCFTCHKLIAYEQKTQDHFKHEITTLPAEGPLPDCKHDLYMKQLNALTQLQSPSRVRDYQVKFISTLLHHLPHLLYFGDARDFRMWAPATRSVTNGSIAQLLSNPTIKNLKILPLVIPSPFTVEEQRCLESVFMQRSKTYGQGEKKEKEEKGALTDTKERRENVELFDVEQILN